MKLIRARWCLVVAAVAVGLAGLTGVPASGVVSNWTGSGVAITGTGVAYPTSGPVGPIIISDDSAASPYPSTITVPPEHDSVITGVRVKVNGLTHSTVRDIDMMLVGPHGQQVMLMSDATGSASNVDITFDDAAATALPYQPVSGTYRPTSSPFDDDVFPAPAPGSTTNKSLAVFNGTRAAGDWKLYVVDDAPTDIGSIESWSLVLDMSPAPYPSEITVSGLTRVQDLNVTLTGFSHTWPADVDVLLVGPQGQQATLLSDAGSSTGVTGLTMTFDDQAAAAPPEGGPLTDGIWKPSNFFTVDDPYPAPAPTSTGATALSVFNGTDPNGTWRLYIADDGNADNGNLVSWKLTFDTDISAPNGTVSINNGAATTTTTAVTLALAATDPGTAQSGVARMRFSNDGATWSPWQPFAATAAWTLASGPDGARTVHVQFADAADNISTTTTDTIRLATTTDTTSPTWTRFVPAKKAKRVSRTVTIKVFASEAINPRTVTDKTVFLKRKGSAKKVKAKVTYNAAKRLITLNPTGTLAKHKTYRVTITPKINDSAGNPFDGNKTRAGTQNLRWIFVTR